MYRSGIFKQSIFIAASTLFFFLSIAIILNLAAIFYLDLSVQTLQTASHFRTSGEISSIFLLCFLYILFRANKKAGAIQKRACTKALSLTISGLSIQLAFYFFMVGIGKYRHLAEMKTFFTQSGYSTGFLYFIIIAEFLAAFGILLNGLFNTGRVAATGLILIMLGAIYTHYANGDPVTDSYDATHQFIRLVFLLLFYFMDQSRHKLQWE